MIRRLTLAVVVLVLCIGAAACHPAAPAAPTGLADNVCGGGPHNTPPDPVDGQIVFDAFAGTTVQAYMNHWIVPRESGCGPAALNPSGAAGLFQLLGHGDLIAACPFLWRSPFDPYCNAWAARQLYDGSGLAPWAESVHRGGVGPVLVVVVWRSGGGVAP